MSENKDKEEPESLVGGNLDVISSQLEKGLKLGDSCEKEENSAGSEEIVINANINGDDDESEEDDDCDIVPMFPMPELVSVPRGDEEEVVVAEYRARLYRFDNEEKEWKERGTGNIKLLQSERDPSVCRVVLWTQVAEKVACNFRLFPLFRVSNFRNNPKALCWKCYDSSYNDEPQWELFTCRFTSEDNCQDFKAKLEECCQIPAANDSVEEVGQCSGCDGCNPDDALIPTVQIKQGPEPTIDIPLAADSSTGLPFVISLRDL